MSNNKISHLVMLQNIINHFSNNSFTLKGLYFSLIAGMLSFYKSSILWLIILIINLLFLFLDSYYLSQEKYYRMVYNKVCILNEEDIDFFMGSKEKNTNYLFEKDSPFKLMFSIPMLPYIGILTIEIIYLILNI